MPESDDQDPQVRPSQFLTQPPHPRDSFLGNIADELDYFIDPAPLPGHNDAVSSQVPDLCAVQVRLCG